MDERAITPEDAGERRYVAAVLLQRGAQGVGDGRATTFGRVLRGAGRALFRGARRRRDELIGKMLGVEGLSIGRERGARGRARVRPHASDDYRAALVAHAMVASMSRKGDCRDNAPSESFLATLRAELVDDEW